MSVKVIGPDIAKYVLQVHGADASGKAVLNRGEQVTDFFGSVGRYVVAMEGTRGFHYWARAIGTFGHEVRLIAPQFVKRYVRGQKNDMQDRPRSMRRLAGRRCVLFRRNQISQQDMQMLHRIRSRLVGNRTQLGNQIRGLLAEYGIIVPRIFINSEGNWSNLQANRTLSSRLLHRNFCFLIGGALQP